MAFSRVDIALRHVGREGNLLRRVRNLRRLHVHRLYMFTL